MKNILVIDQATISTAYTIISIEDNKPKYKRASHVKLHGSRDTRFRMLELFDLVCGLIEEHNIDTLVIEEVITSRSKNWSVTEVLLELKGVMMLISAKYNLKFVVMNINKWKTTAGIKSTTRDRQKAESIGLALKRFPIFKDIIIDCDDVADALNMSYSFLKIQKTI